VATASIEPGPRSRCDDAHLPWETDGAHGGLCASYYVQDIPRREHVPIVFVHGTRPTPGSGCPPWSGSSTAASLDDPEHPLARPNRSETPGDVEYYTIRAANDPFFPENPESLTLDEAVKEQVAADHRGLASVEAVLRRLCDWLRPV
jgi:hypothetical protein